MNLQSPYPVGWGPSTSCPKRGECKDQRRLGPAEVWRSSVCVCVSGGGSPLIAGRDPWDKSRGDPRLTGLARIAPSIPLLAPPPAPERVTSQLGGEA